MIQHNQWAHLWQLDKSIAYLNHGSYGSVPVRVQEVQNAFQDRASANPNRWFRSEMPDLMIEARHIVAYWFGVAPEHFAFVPNASQGVITAVQALVDDAIAQKQQAHLIATSLGYGGVLHGMQHIAARSTAFVRSCQPTMHQQLLCSITSPPRPACCCPLPKSLLRFALLTRTFAL